MDRALTEKERLTRLKKKKNGGEYSRQREEYEERLRERTSSNISAFKSTLIHSTNI